MKRRTDARMRKLWEVCSKFMAEHAVSGSECVHQCDEVILNACDLIAKIGEVVGYDESWKDDK